jgi:hypothetical protein
MSGKLPFSPVEAVMSKFRKRSSALVEAVRYLPDGSNSDEIEAFVGGDGISWKTCNPMVGCLTVLGGEVDLMAGDWVLKGVQGEFYPCKPDIFERTYEEVVGP